MYGQTMAPEDVFSVDKLKSATLSPVKVTISDYWSYKTVTVQVDWTGQGEVGTSKYHTIGKFGDYFYKFSGSTSMGNASATGSIDGNDLGTSMYGGIYLFKDAIMTMEK